MNLGGHNSALNRPLRDQISWLNHSQVSEVTEDGARSYLSLGDPISVLAPNASRDVKRNCDQIRKMELRTRSVFYLHR
jgi:hypothetical protein